MGHRPTKVLGSVSYERLTIAARRRAVHRPCDIARRGIKPINQADAPLSASPAVPCCDQIMSSTSDQVLSGMAAVVTGASSGIGRAIAIALADSGADVLVHARRNRQGTEQVSTELQSLGAATRIELLDLAEPEAQDQLVEQAWTWRDIDIWINNAGADVLTGETSTTSFEKKLELLWKVDVTATIRRSRQVGQRMQSRGQGVILNMGWDQADTGMAGDSGEMFSAIKGAIMAFSASLAKSLAPTVRVNCLAPGWIRTAWGEQASSYWQDRATAESLLERWGTPEDVARTAQFLVSPAAQYITGQTIKINGGLR